MERQKIDKLQNIKNLLEIRTNEIENSINKKLESEFKKSENKIVKILEGKAYGSLENIEVYVSQSLEKDMIQKISEIKEKNKKFVNVNFNDLFSEVKLIIKNYSEELNQSNKISFFDSEIKRKIEDFKSEKDEIEKLKREIFYKKMNYNNQKIREQWAIEKSEKYKVKKERLEKIGNIRNSQLNDLGERPQTETKYLKKFEKVSRGDGFFGKLSNKIFGKKTKMIEVPYEDNSKQLEWDQKKEDIENEFNTQIENMNILDDFDVENVYETKRLDLSWQEEIKSLEELLKEKKETLKQAQEKTKEEYVKNIIENVRNYFLSQSNQIKNVFFKNMIKEKKEEIIKKTEVEYKNLLN